MNDAADAPPRERYALGMHALRARVRNGRLVLDEPTSLPEGAEVVLMAVDGEDDLTDQEREALHDALRTSIAEAQAGKVVDAAVLIAELRRQL